MRCYAICKISVQLHSKYRFSTYIAVENIANVGMERACGKFNDRKQPNLET